MRQTKSFSMYARLGIITFGVFILNFSALSQTSLLPSSPMDTTTIETKPLENGYSEINGIKMYYEIYGAGKPLILIHGGGSTIQSTFAQIIPHFARHRKVIAMELQAHGRTEDRDADSSFEQDADDVAALMHNLHVDHADIFGFSNGATTALQLAIRHPALVDHLVLGSPLAKRSGVIDGFWDFMSNATLDNMPSALQEAYLKVAADPAGLQVMHDRDAKRMLEFKDMPDELLQSIEHPTLIILGNRDVITVEHALWLSRILPHASLAVIPGNHGSYIGEISSLASGSNDSDLVAPLIEKFLDGK